MADLDTRAKRTSGIHVGCPWRGILLDPSGTVTQADRQTIAYFYSGILAEELVEPAVIIARLIPTDYYDIPAQAADSYAIPHQRTDLYTVPAQAEDSYQVGAGA